MILSNMEKMVIDIADYLNIPNASNDQVILIVSQITLIGAAKYCIKTTPSRKKIVTEWLRNKNSLQDLLLHQKLQRKELRYKIFNKEIKKHLMKHGSSRMNVAEISST